MEQLLASWGYLALFGATLLSTMCIPVGSEVAIAYAGALASGQLTTAGNNHLNLALVIVVATAGELVGSGLGYSIGRFGGRPLLDRFGKYLLLTGRDLDRAEAWLDGRGEAFALVGRLVPLVRSFVSLAAGLADMAVAKYTILTVLGCAAWCATLASVGYSLGGSWHHVIKAFDFVGYLAFALVVLIVAAAFWHRFRALRAERPRRAHVAADDLVAAGDDTARGRSETKPRPSTFGGDPSS